VLQTASGYRVVAKIDAEQGLPSQSAFSIAVGGGEHEGVFVGTARGVVRYEARNVPPMLSISKATARRTYTGEEVLSGLALEYPQNGLTVEVSAINSRTYPEQFQYVFRLAGDDGQPIQTGPSRDPRLVLEGLAPNRYRVEVLAYNIDLVESDPVAFELIVADAPFPWTSSALAVLLGLALIALGWGWRQNKRLGGTNRELAETRFQLANETETERRRIARDLHDQTLADLRRLMMMADDLPGASGNGRNGSDPARFRHEVESISTEVRRICEDLSPSALANVGLAAALEWALTDAAAQSSSDKPLDHEFRCDEGFDEKLRLTPAEQIQVYRIVQEALSNVCRHSDATMLRMRLALDGEDLVIEVEDNGRGFDQTNPAASSGRGIANIRSRASLIGATVGWHPGTSTGASTEVTAEARDAGETGRRMEDGARENPGSEPGLQRGTTFTLRRSNRLGV
jgi:signal transduction histidine kinase